MKFIKGKDRNQTVLFPISLEAAIDENNEVRLIDMFVESLELRAMGFTQILPLRFSPRAVVVPRPAGPATPAGLGDSARWLD